MKIREFSFYILNEIDLELFYSHYCNITKFVRFSLMCHLFKSYDFVECSLKKSCLGYYNIISFGEGWGVRGDSVFYIEYLFSLMTILFDIGD
jgi:hypothetical protein